MRRGRGRPRRWGAGGALAFALLLSIAPDVTAQTAYRLANGPTTVVPRMSGFAHGDFAEARLSLAWVQEFQASGLGIVPYAGAAARKGESDMFAGFDFNPGWEAGVLGFLLVGSAERRGAVSVALGFQSTERKLVQYSDDSTLVTLTEMGQRDLTVRLGGEVPVSSGVVVGLGASVRREWDSPGVAKAVEVCVMTDAGGGLVLPSCTDRYAVPLADYWAGQFRADVVADVLALGGARAGPHLALLGGASVDVGQEADARFNVGAGVGVTVARYPGHLIVGALFELHDLTDANGQAPTFADKVAVRVEFGIPFAMLLD